MRPSENAVAPTSVEAARYAYEKLVTLTDAEVRGEAQREQVAALQRERHGGALREPAEPRADAEAIRPRAAERALAEQRDRPGQRTAIAALTASPQASATMPTEFASEGEDDQTGDAAEREAGRGGPVAVECRERTRRERGKQLPERGGDEDDDRARGDMRRRRRKAAR